MEFRVLGPLEAHEGTRALSLGGPRQKALLLRLLLEPNRAVPAERLIDDVWGEQPPATVRTTLQVYVSRLRKLLGADAIETRGPGYTLRLEPEELDSARFERLVATALEESAAGRPERASSLLREALALWRGPALADVAYEQFAQAEITRLEDLRLTALEERIHADLARGHHAELVGELEALVNEHPLRERLRAQLMLALYRAGRQADALDAYRDTRRVLVDELGLEPSALLQQLERAILVQDSALAAPERAAPAAAPFPGERKLVTVLFADLGEDAPLDPERARTHAAHVLAVVQAELEAYGGTVEHGVAGAVLSTFGAPVAQEDHVERALHAALAARAQLAEHGRNGRFGVESGEVIVGPQAESGSFVSGEPVTSAARLVRGARGGEIRIGSRAAHEARSAFELAPAGDGRGVELVIRELSAPRRGPPGLGYAFVGRERELELLERAYLRSLDDRAPQLVTVLGEPGVGKTTLVRELLERLSPAPLELIGRCLAYGRGVTYAPLAGALHALTGGEIAGILGLTLGLDVAGDLHPAVARDRFHDAWVELLSQRVAEQPIVLALDDLHWAEQPLLDLLLDIARRIHGPLFLLGTARPELRFGGEQVWLEPLPDDDVERILGAIAPGLPDRARDLVVAQADGNPFFAEELLGALLDRGDLRRDASGWSLIEQSAERPAPDRVQGVIAARIDLLPPDEKAALQAAAVIGRSFWLGPLRELLEGSEPDVALLTTRDFVRQLEHSTLPGDRELAFKHALTREVAYASLPKRARARLHARFAGWLERARPDDAPLLAHHYFEAARPEDADLAWSDDPQQAAHVRACALRWLRRAAELAAGRYAMQEAVALFDKALELAEDDAVRVELWRAIAQCSWQRYDSEGFREAMEHALALGPPREIATELYAQLAFAGAGRPTVWKELPQPDVIAGWTAEALAWAEPGTAARANALLAHVHADPEHGAEAAAEAREIAEQTGDPWLRSYAYEAEALVASETLRLDEACDWVDRQLALVPELADPDRSSSQFWHAFFAYARAGRLNELREFARRHDEIAAALTPHHEVHAVALHLLVDTVMCAWESGRERTTRAEAAADANVETPCAFNWRALAMCALANAQLGDEREAQRLEERTQEIGQRGGPYSPEAALLRLALLRDDLEGTARLLEMLPARGGAWDVDAAAARLDALAALGDRPRVEEEAALWLDIPSYTRPFALRALGVVRGDRSLLERARGEFTELGLERRVSETDTLLA